MMRSFNPVKGESYCYACISKIFFLLLLFIAPVLSEASSQRLPKKNNWFVSGNTGVAIRSAGIAGGLNFIDDGFRHQPGFAFGLSFGRTFGNTWEPAIRWGAYTLFGQSNLPHYSSAGYYIAYPGLLQQEPLEYITQSNTLSIILRFILSGGNQNDNKSAIIHPFIEAGLGVNNYVNEVRYSQIPAGENASLIFRDRNGEKANGTAQFTTGLGLKIGEQGEWNAVFGMNAEWVNFSTLNPVSQITGTARSSSLTIVSRITAGLTIPIKATIKRDRFMPFRW